MYFDDGKTFSVWARRMNYYATIPAPPTLRELADNLADKYDVELPVADLFYWGERRNTDDIKGAIDLGASQIEGVSTEHYAFRQDGADWQVWIQQGDYPLPRKLVITTTTDPSRPKYTSVLTLEPRAVVQRRGVRLRPAKRCKENHACRSADWRFAALGG